MELVNLIKQNIPVFSLHRHKWEDNIKMDLKEIGVNTRKWIDSAQDRYYWRVLVNMAMEFWVS
jgi:hypothetical protein